jgi:hypothetical protein
MIQGMFGDSPFDKATEGIAQQIKRSSHLQICSSATWVSVHDAGAQDVSRSRVARRVRATSRTT